MALTTEEVDICNQALGKFGAKRFTFGDVTSTPSVLCLLHYPQTRDALLRSYQWRFAKDRSALSTNGTPEFEWDYQFALPDDFLMMRSIYENRFSEENLRSYALEGNLLLTNENSMQIRYIKKVTDTTEFDPLFTEVLILTLAIKLVIPLTGGGSGGLNMEEKLRKELKILIRDVRALDGQESNTTGQDNLETWNDARYA
ncbi:unnamed protein product [marine sediment metagenome]|uniref:Uncharacterized protein n=1 Tax=marine sediment metagenome TaxID=412755 RepID=X0SBW1_9ZZZZ